MTLSELSYRPKVGGGGHGLMALHIEVGGSSGPPEPWDVMAVINKCEEASQMMRMKIKHTIVKPNKEADSEEVSKLLMMLRDRGFSIGLVLEGFSIPTYAREANIIQAVIHGPDWDNFKVHELIYKPEGKELTEPKILQNNALCNKYIQVGKKFDPRKLIRFLSEATFPWGVLIPAEKTISVNFLEGKE